jgi:hypothetical protein
VHSNGHDLLHLFFGDIVPPDMQARHSPIVGRNIR